MKAQDTSDTIKLNSFFAVLGAGSWGTALALLLAQNGEAVRLWDRTPTHIAALQEERENRRYLPGFVLPPSVFPVAEMQAAVGGAACIVIAAPSQAVRQTVALAAPFLGFDCVVVLAAKGMEADGLLPWEIARDVFQAGAHREGQNLPPLVALSGPNLAGEVVQNIPAACVAASHDADAAQKTAHWFNRPAFRVYTSSDITGVEMGGAIKNVLAIAGGVSDGLGFGDNTKAALLTRGLAEMTRLGVACGAQAETFYGLAGVGDLMATSASRLSRNYRVGAGLARGETLETILAGIGQIAEGVQTAQAVRGLARQKNVEMPVCEAVARLLFDRADPREAVQSLMNRAQKTE